jgi:hypothetical protein
MQIGLFLWVLKERKYLFACSLKIGQRKVARMPFLHLCTFLEI